MKISPVFCRNSGNQGTSKMWAFHNKNFYNLNFEQQQESIFKTRGECILFLFMYRGLVSGLRHDRDVKVTYFWQKSAMFLRTLF